MAEIKATMVEISLDEYFDLRQKAEMNGFLMGKLDEFQERFFRLEERICNLERAKMEDK